ncbi:hypothetical protein BJAS_P3464 [Bathymodiolus japonicus methanotrophic gill symbiont]|uniref:hypothetical protein n=1 Tax=Bathymodiolus japonicus methanotrophic gill symbiont TaxID=113269 RepID=UPI001B6661EA|nr:hypothetical protein [Bathymodiolus japonicus methanotrophic gill symbiont]GFO72927.1 hypothetical protein BJAS_P3464 [Bathymodiolus japonicus methanotrophic gill symbiont]
MNIIPLVFAPIVTTGAFLGNQSEGNLSYLNARYMSHSTSRFITQDRAKQYASQYAYGDGSVIAYSDPTGMMWEIENVISNAQVAVVEDAEIVVKEDLVRLEVPLLSKSLKFDNEVIHGNLATTHAEYEQLMQETYAHNHHVLMVDVEKNKRQYQEILKQFTTRKAKGLFSFRQSLTMESKAELTALVNQPERFLTVPSPEYQKEIYEGVAERKIRAFIDAKKRETSHTMQEYDKDIIHNAEHALYKYNTPETEDTINALARVNKVDPLEMKKRLINELLGRE